LVEVTAEWITAIAESISAFTSILLLITSIVLAVVAVRQLPMIAKQIEAQTRQTEAQTEQVGLQVEQTRVQGERERKWETLRACHRYSNDPILHEVAKRVWEATDKGTNYTDDADFDEHDVIVVMNYLEVLAIGVRQGLYIEAIVKDFHEPIIDKMVKVFLLGESGPNWRVDRRLFRSDQFEVLRDLHQESSSGTTRTEYRDQS
jgi:hypothetical protein